MGTPALLADDVSGIDGAMFKETFTVTTCPSDLEEPLLMVQAEPEPSTTVATALAPREPLVATNVRFMRSIDRSNEALVSQITDLSKEAFGKDEEAMQLKKGEQVAVLQIGEQVVCYASYTIRKDVSSLSVSKLAVTPARRRCGLGRTMIRHLIQIAKRRNRSEASLEVICLSALPEAVGFYKACGFHADHLVKLACPSEAIEGQVYMEYTLRRTSKSRSVSKIRSASKRAR